MRVAVVGGGIAGLAAAWEVRDEAEVTVFEPDRLGGRLKTTPFEGFPVDEGPDAFLVRVPQAVQLSREAGLDGELVNPVAGRPLLWIGGRLRPLPEGLVLGVPRDLWGLARGGILSPAGLLRAAMEPALPRTGDPDRLTVRELVAGRFGAQVADRLVDPLIGGIHAGSTATLSAQEVAPQLVEAARQSRSLLLGLRKAAPGAAGPVFAAPRGGMGSLVDAVVGGLTRSGVRFVAETVESVGPGPGGAVTVGAEAFDAAVVATPAPVASRVLGVPALEAVAGGRAASVVVVTVALAGSVLPPDSSGFLVPRTEGRLMTACTFASSKWPHWAAPGCSLVRISAGRDGDERALGLDDDELTERLLHELSEALGTTLSPVKARVSRWTDAFPQYTVGHSRRVQAAEAAVGSRLPTVTLAGSWYRGSGIPACVASGRAAARRCLDSARAQAGTR